MPNTITKRLSEASRELIDGDLLLFRRNGLISRLGRGIHSHAAMIAWWGRLPFVLEIREFRGGRAVTLESQVKRYPGRIDVYRPIPAVNGTRAAEVMRQFAGCDYGWWSVFLAGLRHLPFVRLFVRPKMDDTIINGRPPHCSQGATISYQVGGGVDPVPNLAAEVTEPTDLARSAVFNYQFTLVS